MHLKTDHVHAKELVQFMLPVPNYQQNIDTAASNSYNLVHCGYLINSKGSVYSTPFSRVLHPGQTFII